MHRIWVSDRHIPYACKAMPCLRCCNDVCVFARRLPISDKAVHALLIIHFTWCRSNMLASVFFNKSFMKQQKLLFVHLSDFFGRCCSLSLVLCKQ